jgi:nitroimidazol reductase NimA-like FMN-containing flavoprotein (pyridoxamine 5'-phosphate oxidase superfamily)
MKTQFMNGQSQVCLQVEEITDGTHRRSCHGKCRAEKLTNHSEMERAMKQIADRNPSLTPAITATQSDAPGSETRTCYRIKPELIDGHTWPCDEARPPRKTIQGLSLLAVYNHEVMW